jgi:xylulokinase
MPFVAGVDSSTSACKVEVRDLDTGELVSSGRAPHPPTSPPRSEQDPSAWWSAFEEAAGQADLFGRCRPAAISVAGQQHGLVVMDAAGEVLRPAKLWNDTESAADATALVEAVGAEAWAAACGSVPVASFTITKLRWLRRSEPDLYRQVAAVMLPHDWLTWRLTGVAATDRGDASGTGWWSPADGRYRYDLLALVEERTDWKELLPRVLEPVVPVGQWRDGIVVGPGTGDNMAAALGLGLQPGDMALSLGTSGTAFCVSEKPTADPTGIVAGFADATGRFLPLVCTLNATKVTDAAARLLGVDTAGIDALALAADDSAGLVLVPHLDGERTPNRPAATGALTGIRSDVTREQFAKAVFEGVVCNLLAGADHLPVPVGGAGRLLLIGGGSRSSAYRQVVADLTGRPVFVPAIDELVARGAAIQAAAVLAERSVDEVMTSWGPPEGITIEPRPGADGAAVRAAYAAAEGR